MNGFKVYGLYCALKSHFTTGSSYDFIKYNGIVRTSVKTYNKRSDRNYFEFLAKKYNDDDIVPLLLANFVSNEQTWIGDFTEDFDKAESTYLAWRKKYESLNYVFREDIGNIKTLLDDKGLKFIDLFDVKKQKHPAVFRFLLYGMITIETFIILNDVQAFYKHFDSKFSEDPLWVQWKFKCERYRPFLNVDSGKYKEILKEIIL